MKKILGLSVVLLMFMLIPTDVNAGSIYEKATVKDEYNNKYFVMGLSLREQKKATVSTGYEVTYYAGGNAAAKKEVDAYPKILKARGDVSLSGGGKSTFGEDSEKYSGKTKTFTNSDKYYYTIAVLKATHTFSCKKASWSKTVYN